MSKAICDFCSYPSVVWCYPARSFVAYVVANIGGESVGDWAACEQCHRLIEVGDRAGLTERSSSANASRTSWNSFYVTAPSFSMRRTPCRTRPSSSDYAKPMNT